MTAKKNISGTAPKCWIMGFGLVTALILLAFSFPTLLSCGRDEKTKNEAISMAIPQDSSTEQILPPTRPTVTFAQPVVKKREAVRKKTEKETSKEIEKNTHEVGKDYDEEIHEEPVMIPTQDLNKPVEEARDDANKVYLTYEIDKMPIFPGGDAELQKYLAHNLKYPSIDREKGAFPGTVVIQFFIEKDGTLSNIQVVRGFEDVTWSKEVQRVVGAMPKWSPGEINGNAVRVTFTLPIKIRWE